MNTYLRAVIAGAAGLLLVVAAPGSAAFGDELWPDTADCATGEFSDPVIRPSDQLGPVLELRGRVGPCPKSDKDPDPRVSGRFGFAYVGWTAVLSPGRQPTVRAAGVVYDKRLRPYEAATEPTEFAGRFDFAAGEYVGDGAAAICLMRDPATRLACLVVELDDDLPTVTPVPVTDPRVQARMTVVPTGGNTWPNCGTCL
ncbi:hypothetical protein [Phytohabitans houttuyneae]|uniref:Uncharacterized protein n=1 Tax=Phytohabitans houttuyneae TaxID=1076126 RepID=A0A6V8KES9_9ACTN|nr:hypothetical protein [Phytohabitans houttuyneae]GFJ83712.1 hypothetical protein Phou_078920 [Phytohabitans houttuyneae]